MGRAVDYTKLYNDIREAIDTVHRDDSLKAVIRQDIGRYIFKDPELGPALHKLRSGGKRLFVLTNSLWDYTDAVMSYLLDGLVPEYPSWRNYFDVVITGASKPAFFSERAAHSRDRRHHRGQHGAGRGHGAGARQDLPGRQPAGLREAHRHARATRCCTSAITSTATSSSRKKTSLWRTCMVVQEIEDELVYLESRREEIERLADLEQLQARLDDEVGRHKARLNSIEKRLEKDKPEPAAKETLEADFKAVKLELDRLRKAFKEVGELVRTLEGDVERGFNASWGLHFKEGNENSRFGEQVEQYACLYTSRVSNLGFYSPMQYFRSPREFMPHELAGGLSGKLGTMGSEGLPKAANRAPTEIP